VQNQQGAMEDPKQQAIERTPFIAAELGRGELSAT
jgi:hypothetical protein